MKPNQLQKTDEWFSARKGKITASNVGAILGLSPYRTKDDVMRDMVRDWFGAEKEFKGNAATEYGNEHEKDALAALEAERDALVVSTGFHVHPEFAWLGASPDGFMGEHVVEVKCPYKKEMFNLDSRKDYWAQVQIQMACCGKSSALFGVWVPGFIDITPVDYDPVWMSSALPELEQFYKDFKNIITSEDLSKPYLEPKVQDMESSEAWAELVAEYDRAKTAVDTAKSALDDIKKQLIDLAGGRKSKGCGVSVYPVKGRTTTDYKKLIANHCPDVDLSQYQKTGKESWLVK